VQTHHAYPNYLADPQVALLELKSRRPTVIKPSHIAELANQLRGVVDWLDGVSPQVTEPPDRRLTHIDVRSAGPLVVDSAGRRATVSGRLVHLTPTEFDMLSLLVEQQERVVTFNQFSGNSRKSGSTSRRNLKVYIGRLRKKLAIAPGGWGGHIVSVPNFGYRLDIVPTAAVIHSTG